jgi:cell wall-associated NlpC family hydrolase
VIDLSRWVWQGSASVDEVVAAARALRETPFVPHGRLPGKGVDCIGLGVLVCRACGLVKPDADITGYPLVPDGTLVEICDRLLIPAKPSAGGMGIFIMGGAQAHHLGIFAPYAHGKLSIVHAIGPGGRNRVKETRMLPEMRLVRSYSIPGVA